MDRTRFERDRIVPSPPGSQGIERGRFVPSPPSSQGIGRDRFVQSVGTSTFLESQSSGPSALSRSPPPPPQLSRDRGPQRSASHRKRKRKGRENRDVYGILSSDDSEEEKSEETFGERRSRIGRNSTRSQRSESMGPWNGLFSEGSDNYGRGQRREESASRKLRSRSARRKMPSLEDMDDDFGDEMLSLQRVGNGRRKMPSLDDMEDDLGEEMMSFERGGRREERGRDERSEFSGGLDMTLGGAGSVGASQFSGALTVFPRGAGT